MGSPKSEACRTIWETQHPVTLTRGFEIGTTEVTCSQFKQVMGYPNSCAGFEHHPVINVSWHEAAAYCNALSKMVPCLPQCYSCSGTGTSVSCTPAAAYSGAQGIYPCLGYRLPTDAEWEYAYRATTTTSYYSGASSGCTSNGIVDSIAWYYSNTNPKKRMAVAQKTANPWGTFDMSGNVSELTNDWFKPDLGSAAVTDPQGPKSHTSGWKVMRGGNYYSKAGVVRAAYRNPVGVASSPNATGFRCVRTLELNLPPTCGNGAIDSGEQCDGTNLGGKTCSAVGFGGGTLGCRSDCRFDKSKCRTKGMQMIKAGNVGMGSIGSEPCRELAGGKETVITRTLTHDYEIGETEVTQAEFKALMGYNPSSFLSCGNTCPVESVTWHEATAYCNALSKKNGFNRCYSCKGKNNLVQCQTIPNIFDCLGYRLPTEAEWEYAYRAGSTTAYYSGGATPGLCQSCSAQDANLSKIGWYKCNSGGKTQPVAKKTANNWQLYDMAGNVEEWVNDGYASDLNTSKAIDPWGDVSASDRVYRGGSWNAHAHMNRAAWRNGSSPNSKFNYRGFRCVRSMKP